MTVDFTVREKQLSAYDERRVPTLKANAKLLEEVIDDSFLICRCLTGQASPDPLQLLDGVAMPGPKGLDREGEKGHVLSSAGVEGCGHLPLVSDVQSDAELDGASVDQAGFFGKLRNSN